MRRDVERRVSADGEERSASDLRRIGENLIEQIRPLVDQQQGVGPEVLARALDQALLEVGAHWKSGEISGRELRSMLLGLILWRVFGRGSTLWISPKTEAGHEVPLDVLVLAFLMWGKALNLAARYGVDEAAAAEAIAGATHATTDRLAGSAKERDPRGIRDVRSYLFATYMYMILGTAGRQGSGRTDYVDIEDWIANRELSDKGTFLDFLESGIYCRELLEAMPPKARSVAIARYVLGYSWTETAGALGSSVNAAQKALSTGVRKAVGTCMRELRKARHRVPAAIVPRRNKSSNSTS